MKFFCPGEKREKKKARDGYLDTLGVVETRHLPIQSRLDYINLLYKL